MGKASLPKTSINDTLDANKERKKQFGRERGAFSRVSGVAVNSGSGVNATSNNVIQVPSLQTAGGTMMGPIAFYPRLQFITSPSTTLDISKSTGTAYSSRVIVSGSSSAATVSTISGAAHAGQILFLQAASAQTITINETGNISIPNSTSSYVMTANEIILLQYDTTTTKWITVNLTSGGGGGWVGTATSDLNMNTWDITNMDRIFFSSNTDFFTNTDNVLLRDNNGFNWNLSDNTDTHSFYFTGAKEFEITNTQITTNNVIPDTGGTYTVGTASDTYLEGYFTRVKDVQNLQGDGVNLMKVIFDEGLDSDTYITGTLTSPRDRINHVVNGINTQWWVEDSSGNKEIGIASSQNIQFNLGDNWMLLKGRGVVTPGSNSQANLFFDSSDDVLKIRKKNASGVVSTVSLEGGGTGMQNPATASLDMDNKTIVDIDWLTFDSVSTPSVANIAIYTDSVDILVKKASGAGVNLTSGFANGNATGDLDMNNNDVLNSQSIRFNAVGWAGTNGAIWYDSSGDLKGKSSNGGTFVIDGSSSGPGLASNNIWTGTNTFNGNLYTTSYTSLGNQLSDVIDITGILRHGPSTTGLGFFGAAWVSQQSLPSLPSTVQIKSLLQAYGLCS